MAAAPWEPYGHPNSQQHDRVGITTSSRRLPLRARPSPSPLRARGVLRTRSQVPGVADALRPRRRPTLLLRRAAVLAVEDGLCPEVVDLSGGQTEHHHVLVGGLERCLLIRSM